MRITSLHVIDPPRLTAKGVQILCNFDLHLDGIVVHGASVVRFTDGTLYVWSPPAAVSKPVSFSKDLVAEVLAALSTALPHNRPVSFGEVAA